MSVRGLFGNGIGRSHMFSVTKSPSLLLVVANIHLLLIVDLKYWEWEPPFCISNKTLKKKK